MIRFEDILNYIAQMLPIPIRLLKRFKIFKIFWNRLRAIVFYFSTRKNVVYNNAVLEVNDAWGGNVYIFKRIRCRTDLNQKLSTY